MRVFGPRNFAHAIFDIRTFCIVSHRQTDIPIPIYISRDISIEHPSVGLALLAQLA